MFQSGVECDERPPLLISSGWCSDNELLMQINEGSDFSRIFQIACGCFKGAADFLCIRIILKLLPVIVSERL